MTATGTPPTFIQNVINTLDSNNQIVALVDFASTEYLRNSFVLVSILSSAGYANTDIDGFFISANAL